LLRIISKMNIDFLQDVLGHSVTIFTIMNPLSVGVIMLGLLHENASKQEVRQIATKTTRAAFIAMLVTFLLGTYLFDFFGISPDGLRIFGGTILFIMGLNMVQGHGKKVNHTHTDQKAALNRDDISVVPLAIPVMVGAGLATTLINLSIAAETWQDYLSGVIAIIICSVATLLILQRMPFIRQTLGDNGLKVFNRIMGLIVGSLAAQMILSGMVSFYQGNFT
jgi:multiple antibiotic resistance protein